MNQVSFLFLANLIISFVLHYIYLYIENIHVYDNTKFGEKICNNLNVEYLIIESLIEYFISQIAKDSIDVPYI